MMEGMTTPALPRRPCLTASSALALPVTCLASHQRGPPQPTVTNHSHTGVPEGSATANLLLRQTGGDMSGETAEAAPAPKSSSSSTTSWVTLATNDSYAVGALVLAVSLRKAETKHSLTVLITHGVTDHMKNVLGEIFDLVHLVDPLDSGDENRLELMSRPELGITLTKIHSWTLTNIDKGVFLDADTLVIRNCDELFEREEFSAAPDVGWPDCFNSGVFVFKPSLETFRNLVQCALTKGSFDGGDQGLLNTYFNEWATKDISRHLPFIYNMVSSATYTYLPAFLKYGSEARIVHFLGSGNKPWLAPFDWSRGVATAPAGAQHSLPLLQLWWDIYAKSVHGKLTREMSGLAGVLAQMTIGGTATPAEQTLAEDLNRRQAWEQGIIDYTGRDAFENIWKKICQTIASGPAETSQIPAGSQQAPVDITTKQQVVPATPEEKKAFAIVPMTPPPVLDEFISVKPEDIIALPSPVPENAPEGLVAPEAPKIIETPATPGTPDAALLLGSKPEIQQKLQKTDVVKEQLPAPTEQQADQPVAAESKLTETPSTPALLDSLKEQTTTKTEEVCLSEKKEKSVDVVPASEQVAQEQPVPAAQTEIKLTPEVPVATHEQTQQLEQTPIAPEQTQSSEQVPKAPEVPEASAPVIEQQIAPTTQTQEQAIPTPSAVPEESISSVPTPEQTAPTPIAPSEPSTPLVPVPEQSTPVVPSEENTPPVSAPEQATPAPKESAPTTPTPKSEQITPIPSALEQTTPTPVPVSEHITASLPTTTTPEQSTPTLTKEQSSPEPAPEQTKTASEKPPPPPVPELVPTPESSPATPAPPTPESTSVATTEQTTLVQQSISPSAAVAPPAEQSSTAPAPPTPETISAPPAVPSVSPAQQSDPPSAAVAPPAEQSSTPVPPTPETTSAPTAVPSDSPAQLSAPPSAPVAPPTEQSSTAPAEQPPPAEQTAAPVTAQEQPEKGAAAAPVSPVAATEAPASPAKEATGADPPVPPKRKGKKKSH